jgi:hypothetical protein
VKTAGHTLFDPARKELTSLGDRCPRGLDPVGRGTRQVTAGKCDLTDHISAQLGAAAQTGTPAYGTDKCDLIVGHSLAQ